MLRLLYVDMKLCHTCLVIRINRQWWTVMDQGVRFMDGAAEYVRVRPFRLRGGEMFSLVNRVLAYQVT